MSTAQVPIQALAKEQELTKSPRRIIAYVSLDGILAKFRGFFGGSKARHIWTSTCDGVVLRLHYRWTLRLLIGIFFAVCLSWYVRDVITCTSKFNADIQVRLDYLNICLSFPFVIDDDGSKRVLLYYRWIPLTMLVLAFVYYIPRKVSKNLENTRCKKLLEDLAANSYRYDITEEKLVEVASRYTSFNLNTHNGLYWKYLFVNVLALVIDIFTFCFLDSLLNGRFIQYGIMAYPFQRETDTFSDYISRTFPPFASCEISESHQLVNKRIERFGCHLTIMELYEKVFLVLWFWLVILSFITCCYIVFLLCMLLPCVSKYLLRTAKPAHVSTKILGTITNVLQNFKTGDIYLLYCLKPHMSHTRFYEMLQRLSDPSLFKKKTEQNETSGLIGNYYDDMSLSHVDSLKMTVLPDHPINSGPVRQHHACPERDPTLNEGSISVVLE